jgi:hypothetical protein
MKLLYGLPIRGSCIICLYMSKSVDAQYLLVKKFTVKKTHTSLYCLALSILPEQLYSCEFDD